LASWRFASFFYLLLLAACGGTSGDGRAGDEFVPAEVRVKRLAITAIDKIDVLFVIDRSGSMREEQQALSEQFPVIARALASGDIDADGEIDFPPPGDVQFGVISSDLGLAGITDIDKCSGLGDDGLLAPPARGAAPGCAAPLPPFLRYRSGQDDVEQVAREFACLAALGTDGCGFEQPLEATLKALWPASDERVSFLGPNGQGHGDAANAGFSRAEPGTVPSLLVIVLITDEDDCSTVDPSIFTPSDHLPLEDPRVQQDLNLRCFHNQDTLYPLERFANGLQALRPGAEQLVMFTAIAGVPPETLDGEGGDDPDLSDPRARDQFYAGLLADPRMQERPDSNRTPEQGGNLLPVCETDSARAYPARRIVQVAQAFGENGTVQSICRRDFASVLRFVLERVAHRMRNPG
jgi:hypothetical protein